MPPLKAYNAELPYSYAAGVFPSITLMQAAPERARRLLLSSRAQGEGVDKLRTLCEAQGVREEIADKALARLSGKQNCFAAVVFDKWQADLRGSAPHVALVSPMDEGNLGTILRTLLGFGLTDIAIIRPAADVFEPRVIRASMGAIFSLNVKQYDDFSAYRAETPTHMLYPFMLDGAMPLSQAVKEQKGLYTLIFGNEGSGLSPEFAGIGKAVRIPHSQTIDSLNLAVAVAIGAYAFTQDKQQEA